MVVVMMAPTAWPWLRAYATLAAPSPAARSWRSGATFALGYLGVWVPYSLAMAALQLWLASIGALAGDRLSAGAGGAVLVAAGLYQFAPLKSACLTHCRNPLTYFLAHWHDGPVGGVRLGLAHGAYCLGCCWAVMLTAFAMGVMNLWWMAALTVGVAAEQLTPWGVWVARALGTALVIAGVRQLL